LFHEALSVQGFLGIGARETVRFSSHAARFRELSATNRIYRKVGL
jgi:chemotaxis protein methyltransferase CheR